MPRPSKKSSAPSDPLSTDSAGLDVNEALLHIPNSKTNGISMHDLYRSMDAFLNSDHIKETTPDIPDAFLQYPTDHELEQEQRIDEREQEELDRLEAGEFDDEEDED